jgi:hypothetical protein
MDPDILQNFIDRGMSLGFHGHQHRPQFLDTRFRHEGTRRITVISAGTLCGNASFGFRRSYNVVELDLVDRKGWLHVREMLNDNLQLPIWGRRPLPPNVDGVLEFKFDPPPEPDIRPDAGTALLIAAQKHYDKGEYREAADVLHPKAKTDQLARRLLLECYLQLHDNAAIIADFDPPKGSGEAVHLMEALWTEGKRERLRKVLALAVVAKATDPSVVEMRDKWAARLKK